MTRFRSGLGFAIARDKSRENWPNGPWRQAEWTGGGDLRDAYGRAQSNPEPRHPMKPDPSALLAGLARGLEAGGSVELRLTFEHAGDIVVPAAIRAGCRSA